MFENNNIVKNNNIKQKRIKFLQIKIMIYFNFNQTSDNTISCLWIVPKNYKYI